MHVDDLALGCEAFIQSVIRHGLYNLGGGPENSLTLRELVGRLETVSGLQAVIDEAHPLDAPVPLNYVTDLSLVKQELDWSPEVAMDDGLKTLFA